MAHPLLTDRQNEVMRLVCSGDYSHHEVTDLLGVSRSMFMQYMVSIRRRLGRESIDDLCQVFLETSSPARPGPIKEMP